jgi:hypothetical protein
MQQIQGVSSKALALIKKLKPYQGGNNTLWRVHRLDIVDKHRLLVPVAAVHTKTGIQWAITGPGLPDLPPTQKMIVPATNRKFPLEDGDVLGTYPRVIADGYKDESKIEFAIEIAFGEGQIFDGQPVIPTLHEIIDFTERLIDIFARYIFKADW